MTISIGANLIPPTQFFGHLQLVRDGKEIEVQAPNPTTIGFWR